ncbi:MAG: prepilin-type N-terminal cleavage/methylation domain-containing protein [Actinomycetota bacterium]|nr:prepilin-type N-terminal cleavage/methylation domain-containing protein [Actinomycetota bacterium]
MTRSGRRKREAGFTLVEVLVAAAMMFAVLFALYAVFDVSARAYGYGGNRVEAVGNARLAMDRMEREIRAAFPYDRATDPPKRYLFLDPLDPTKPAVPTATRVAFGNETTGDRKIETNEVIDYYLSGHDLKRSKGGSVQTLLDSVATDGLRFTPCRSAEDCPPAVSVADEAEIRLLRIELAVDVERRGEDPARQRLATDVYLRNRGESR